MIKEKKNIWKLLLTPIRQRAYNNLPAREFSPYDPHDYTSSDTPESFDGTSFSEIFKEMLKGDNANKWLKKAINIVDTYKHISKNKPEAYYDALSYIGHEDAKDKYLQLPQKNNTVIKSRYKPSIYKDTNSNYYTFKYWTPEYWGREIDESPSHVVASMEDFASNNGKTGSTQAYDTTLNEFKRGYGIDPKKGQYMSIYDIWDYNTKVKSGGKDNIASKIGAKPFEIYDRVYLDDYYNVNSAPEKGTYYGGYVPEITVYPSNKLGGKLWKKQ